MAAAEGRDIDIFGVHADPPFVAVNLFHVRNGRVVDRREFYWEDVHSFEKREFLSSLLMQIYLDAQYVPSLIHVPTDFEDLDVMEELLSEKRGPQGRDLNAPSVVPSGPCSTLSRPTRGMVSSSASE